MHRCVRYFAVAAGRFALFHDAAVRHASLKHLRLADVLQYLRQHADTYRPKWTAATEASLSDLQRRPVILGIDEIAKTSSSGGTLKDDTIATILTSVAKTMSLDFNLWSLVTSLDYLPDVLTKSNRAVCWVPLPPIDPISLLVENKMEGLVMNRNSNSLENAAALAFMSDLGGHPRSIDITLAYLQHAPRSSYDVLARHLVQDSTSSLGLQARALTLQQVVPCILGEYRDFSPNSVQIQVPAYLNSVSTENPEQIPEISIVLLRLFCRHALQGNLSDLERSIANHLQEYCDIDVATPDDGTYFEQAGRLRDVLVRECLVYRGITDVTLSHLYGIREPSLATRAQFVPASRPNAPGWLWQKSADLDPSAEKIRLSDKPYVIQQLEHQVSSRHAVTDEDASPQSEHSTCFGGVHNQPGWDHCFVDELISPTGQSVRHQTFVELKMSAVRADGTMPATAFGFKDLQAKYSLLEKHNPRGETFDC